MSASYDDRGENLTAQEAFLAMTDFVWQYARRNPEYMMTILADIQIYPNGETADPAAWTDWLDSVAWVKSGKPPRTGS
ncbi:hypothetical protein [Cellulomonas shaoxiangyii]|uniref:Uncharacterized protein n=1 Tax=Cellulomonas shaoxiangyii TaxID=2566013 RepID=A0A4P7SHC9_9CELL|nr:hypothetical protein [Cellulomonas shaoxiangyii]QCB92506.1 hypothetical protein E5225_01980 [Cellulomonas shaoxiangyii]TGY83403.1 hypothetical protein E5226_12280 [Cellulomonas shaoxiangyii]